MSKDLLYKIVGIDDFTSVMQGAEKEGTTSFRTLDREQNKVISGSEKLTNSFGKLKGVIAGAGIVAGAWKIGRQAMETLQLYDTQIQAETQLKNALEQTGNTAKKTQDELTQRASKLQDNSLIGDEVWMQAMTKLTEYRNVSGKVFDEAVVMAGEMATRMGTDVVSSAKLLGSALNEPEKGLEKLREVGVTFSKKQAEAFKKLVDAGKKEEAQLILLSQLQKNFGGAMQASVKVGLGSYKQLKNTIGDVKEAVGSRLMPTFQKLTRETKNLADTTLEWVSIPVSKKMEDERVSANVLARQLGDTNISEEERRKILTELEKINPKIVDGLNAENIEMGKLVDNLRAYNDEQIKRIIIQKKQEEIDKANRRAQNSGVKSQEAMMEIEKRFFGTIEQMKQKNPALGAFAEQVYYGQYANNSDAYKSLDNETKVFLNKAGFANAQTSDEYRLAELATIRKLATSLGISTTDLYGKDIHGFLKYRNNRNYYEQIAGSGSSEIDRMKQMWGISTLGGSSGTGTSSTLGGTDSSTDALASIQGDTRKVTNLTINIDKQIESVNIESSGNIEDDIPTFMGKLRIGLAELVNDVNYMVE